MVSKAWPKPLNELLGSARLSCGSENRPCASACQISSMLSATIFRKDDRLRQTLINRVIGRKRQSFAISDRAVTLEAAPLQLHHELRMQVSRGGTGGQARNNGPQSKALRVYATIAFRGSTFELA